MAVQPQQRRERMRKLATLFTDLLLGPAPTPPGGPTSAPRHAVPASESVAEIVVVDDHLHDFLGLFPSEVAPHAALASPDAGSRGVAGHGAPFVERRRHPRTQLPRLA